MSKIAIVAALEREVSPLIRNWSPVRREHQGRGFTFFERGDVVVICGGIGVEAARRAAEAVIALYGPLLLQSVGFAGALDTTLRAGDTFSPSLLLDARDGSRLQLPGGDGTLITYNAVAGAGQKAKLAEAYQARAVDMEAAAVATSASSHRIAFGVTKVISDELDFEMPGMSAFIDGQGRFRTMSFTFFALLRPWLWMRLAILARNSSKAAHALSASLQSFCAQPGPVVPSPSTTALPTGSPQ
jgi:adenosylhomocysteine nucleosidase